VYVNFEVECHINIPSDLIQRFGPVMTVWTTDTLSVFCTLSIVYIEQNTRHFRSRLCFHLQTKKHPTGWTPPIEPVPVTGQHGNIQCVTIWAWEQLNIKAWNTSQIKTIKKSHELSWPREEILSWWLFFVVPGCIV
jgi:hypothetical protein